MRLVRYLVILLGLGIVVPCSPLAATQTAPFSHDVVGRLLENYRSVLAAVFPLPAEYMPENVVWSVDVLVIKHEANELKFRIKQTFNDGAIAVVSRPIGESVWTQMKDLKAQNPSMAVEDIVPRIAVGEIVVTETGSPLLRDLASEFEKLLLPAEVSGDLYMHGTQYELWVRSQNGNELYWKFQGPGVQSTEASHPVVKWIEDVCRTLCD